MAFRYQLREPDDYYHQGCYLLIERVAIVNNETANSLRGFTKIDGAPRPVWIEREKNHPEKGFSWLVNSWDVSIKNIPFPVGIEVAAGMAPKDMEPFDYSFQFNACLPLKMKLIRESF